MVTRMAPRLMAVLFLVVGCAGGGGPAPLSEADKSAVRANDENFVQGVLAKNWTAVAALCTATVWETSPTGVAGLP